MSRTVPRSKLGHLESGGRDPLGILAAQEATRLPDLLPLRAERMISSPFAFYRGTAALMAADLGASPSSGILVASCGDAHVANFGFYASPQRTLVFDLNDFDEAAWAPWEWDLKRLVASIIIAGQDTGRDAAVTEEAARSTVRQYITALRAGLANTPLGRYYLHFDVDGEVPNAGEAAHRVLTAAITAAEKRTGARAARKLLTRGDDGQLRFTEAPPVTTHISAEVEQRVGAALTAYLQTTRADIRLLIGHYRLVDTVRRVVGVGSVGTRCYLSALIANDESALLLQTKEAGRSVLVEYGHAAQPAEVDAFIETAGQGGRVVAMQRILQGVSDPFLGSFRGEHQDYYVRQFRDMKGGIDAETLDDEVFGVYARTCAAVLARAHAQSPTADAIATYIGGGGRITDAIVAWAQAYAELSRADYDAFVAAHA